MILLSPDEEVNDSNGGGRGGSGRRGRDEAVRAILEKSFLPHQKGQAREHCSLGHRLELPILYNWIQIVSGDSSPAIGLDVKGAYTAGLAAKKDAPFAKDSIDFVITVAEADEPDEIKVWGFKAKGRVAARTAAEEESLNI